MAPVTPTTSKAVGKFFIHGQSVLKTSMSIFIVLAVVIGFHFCMGEIKRYRINSILNSFENLNAQMAEYYATDKNCPQLVNFLSEDIAIAKDRPKVDINRNDMVDLRYTQAVTASGKACCLLSVRLDDSLGGGTLDYALLFDPTTNGSPSFVCGVHGPESNNDTTYQYAPVKCKHDVIRDY